MRTLRILALVPYCVFFAVVLAPLAALSYALASVARTIYSGALSGWRDHA